MDDDESLMCASALVMKHRRLSGPSVQLCEVSMTRPPRLGDSPLQRGGAALRHADKCICPLCAWGMSYVDKVLLSPNKGEQHWTVSLVLGC